MAVNNINYTNSNKDNKINVDYELRRKSNKESAQACAIEAITGVGTGICANFIKKDKNAALNTESGHTLFHQQLCLF